MCDFRESSGVYMQFSQRKGYDQKICNFVHPPYKIMNIIIHLIGWNGVDLTPATHFLVSMILVRSTPFQPVENKVMFTLLSGRWTQLNSKNSYDVQAPIATLSYLTTQELSLLVHQAQIQPSSSNKIKLFFSLSQILKGGSNSIHENGVTALNLKSFS